MTDWDSERHIGETMAEVLRERLVELETLEAAGAATKHTVRRLDYVRTLLGRVYNQNGIMRMLTAYNIAAKQVSVFS